MLPENDIARRTAERAARESYGRMVAILAARTRDLSAAEDALSEAFRIALDTWPQRGVPDRPEAWLLTTARRRLAHGFRHARVVQNAASTVDIMSDESLARITAKDTSDMPDERLKLMFICAHPAIDESIQAPLMLQTVLGLAAARIARCFLIPAATLGQRLVRAKIKIRDAGIRFAAPEPDELADRLDAVLTAIYAAYSTGWDDMAGDSPSHAGLADEAIWLARVVTGLLPSEPEAKGLLALMLYCEARRPARRCPNGVFVPLDQQDSRRWSRAMIIEAEACLTDAARHGIMGRFQLEAAIQSVHVQRPVTGKTNWAALVQLYDALVKLAPTMGALVARAAVVAEAGAPSMAREQLMALPTEALEYQPYWASLGRVMRLLGQKADAERAFARAAALSTDPAVRAFMLAQAKDGAMD